MEAVELRSARVRLAAPTLADVSELAAACSAEDILFVLNKQRYTEEDAEGYVHYATEGWESDRRYAWLLHDEEGRLLGQVSLDRKGHADSAVIGYWLAPEARGKGYLTEAGKAMLNWALDVAGADLSRVIWAAYEWNAASLKLAERLGFKLVGTREAGELGWNFRGRANLAHFDR
jgi:RimJ/RimL family protein N-acetyltransferase